MGLKLDDHAFLYDERVARYTRNARSDSSQRLFGSQAEPMKGRPDGGQTSFLNTSRKPKINPIISCTNREESWWVSIIPQAGETTADVRGFC